MVNGMEQPAQKLSFLEERFLNAFGRADSLEIIKDCLAQNVNVNVTDETGPGNTFLMKVLFWGRYNEAHLLLQQKNIEVNPVVESRMWYTCTPAHTLLDSSYLTPVQKEELLRLLMQKGADINAVSSSKVTVIESAIRAMTHENVALLEMLIDANVLLKPNSQGIAPLTQAIGRNIPPLIPVILKSSFLTKYDIEEALIESGQKFCDRMWALCEDADIREENRGEIELRKSLKKISNDLQALEDKQKKPLKILNAHYTNIREIIEGVKDISSKCGCRGRSGPKPMPNRPILIKPNQAEKLATSKKSLTELSDCRTIYTMLCNYYKIMVFMERATKSHNEWQASRKFGLPTDLMKMIAYHCAAQTKSDQ